MTTIDPSKAGQCFTAILASKDLQKLPMQQRRARFRFTTMVHKGEDAISHALTEALDEVRNLIDQGLVTDLAMPAQSNLGPEHDSAKLTPPTEPAACAAGLDEQSIGDVVPAGDATPPDTCEADSPCANESETGAGDCGDPTSQSDTEDDEASEGTSASDVAPPLGLQGVPAASTERGSDLHARHQIDRETIIRRASESYYFAEGLATTSSNGGYDGATIADPSPEVTMAKASTAQRAQAPVECSAELDATPGRAPRTGKGSEAETPGPRSQGPSPTAYGSTDAGGIVLCHNKHPEAAAKGGETSTSRRFSSTHEAPQFVIDDRLRHLLPPLSEEEQAGLEREILRDGCTDSLICYMRDGSYVLIDGHHRYEIVQRNNLPFAVTVIEIQSIEEAQAWILEHARGRRNLSLVASRFVRGQSYNLQRAQGARTDLQATSGQSDQKSTAQRLAELHGVGEKTIRREGKFAETVESVTAKYGVKFRARALAPGGLTARDFAALPQLDEPAARGFVEQVVDGSYRPGGISKALNERGGKAPRGSRPKPGDSVTFELAERDGVHFGVVDIGSLRIRIELSEGAGRVSVLGRGTEGSASTGY